MIRIEPTEDYIRDLKYLLEANPDISGEIDKRISWFIKKPADERLENHDLTGKMSGLSAFSITNDIRIVYRWLDNYHVRFLAIGNHNEVYGVSP